MMKELNLFCFITNLAVAVLIGALLPVLPVLTRKSYLFGVKIPLENHNCPEAKNMKKHYITICLTGTAVIFALIIAQFAFFPDMTLLATMYFPFIFTAVQMAAFIPNWKRALKLKEERGWKVSESAFADTKSSHSRGNLSDLPWAWYVAGLILIIVSVIISLVQYPNLPDRIPTHFDINMQPDAWSDKSLFTLMFLPLINLATLALMWFVGVMFVRAKLQIDAQNPELSFAQHRIYRRRIGHSTGFLALGMVILFVILGFMSVFPEFTVSFWLTIALVIITTVPLIAVTIHSGQGGCRIKPKIITESTVQNKRNHLMPTTTTAADATIATTDISGRGDDKYWLLGTFYYNPDDPSYIIENRFGNKLGFNYSRLPVKIGLVALLSALIAMYVWITVWLV